MYVPWGQGFSFFFFFFYWQYPNPYNSGWTHSRLSRSICCVNNWMKSLSRRLRINFDPVWVIRPSLKLLPWLGKWCSYWLGWSKCMIDPPELHGLRLREDDSLKLEVCYLTRIREWASKNNNLSTFKIFDNLTFTNLEKINKILLDISNLFSLSRKIRKIPINYFTKQNQIHYW